MTDSLSIELLVAGHRVARLLDGGLRAVGLSAGEAVLLTALGEGALTMGGIMGTLHIGGSTATSLVTRLERAGLVTKTRNPEDARSYIVEVTDAGRAAGETARAAFGAIDRELGAAGQTAIAGHRSLMARLAALAPALD
ncbi:MarR family winged helix-turn-helix transcriptional regulator [Microterricola gilva]|nr:MarR family transcriptional regulator [Microterricola gilva]